jgi:hypothetical protein
MNREQAKVASTLTQVDSDVAAASYAYLHLATIV